MVTTLILGYSLAFAGLAIDATAGMTYRNRKVGGIRFIRIGRLQLSFCVVKRED